MDRLPHWLRRVLAAGNAAGLLSGAAIVARSRRDAGDPLAGINAVSHWLHGPSAYRVDGATWRHTPAGAVVHYASAFLWAALYELLLANVLRTRRGSDAAVRGTPSAADLVAGAAVVTAVAAWTDLRAVPARLTPGFEHRLRPTSVAWVYAAFALGLVAAGAATQRGRLLGARGSAASA